MQVHTTLTAAVATLTSRYRIDAGGYLQCEWDPVIPFPDAQLDQRIFIDLAAEATLLWSDALMAGREASGERWRFQSLAHELRLTREGTLAYLERYRIAPGTDHPGHRWVADKGCYFGTLLATGDAIGRPVAADAHREIALCESICGSADWLDEWLLLARVVSADGSSFHRARQTLLRIFAGRRP
jgi:urease accessory protein